ncbi:hypothetical protein J6590_048562 [Homalodisca vitripennis]|nr:hypothetical protein J6590_048562 [Homalodisca vitripennis]
MANGVATFETQIESVMKVIVVKTHLQNAVHLAVLARICVNAALSHSSDFRLYLDDFITDLGEDTLRWLRGVREGEMVGGEFEPDLIQLGHINIERVSPCVQLLLLLPLSLYARSRLPPPPRRHPCRNTAEHVNSTLVEEGGDQPTAAISSVTNSTLRCQPRYQATTKMAAAAPIIIRRLGC